MTSPGLYALALILTALDAGKAGPGISKLSRSVRRKTMPDPATTATELIKRVQTRQFELARAIEQRNHAIAMESPYEAGQLIQTSDGTRQVAALKAAIPAPTPAS